MLDQARLLGAAIGAGLLFFGAGPSMAAPLICDAVTGDECQITTLHDLGAGGTFEVDRTLHIFGPGGELRTSPGSTLTLNITGGVTIDGGGKITGNAAAGNSSGATISITAGGAVLLAGDGASGATISVDQLGRTCGGGGGGNISITSTFQSAGPSIRTQGGSRITADARCSAGEIDIVATKGGVVISGLVQSVSTLSGTGATQRPGGGPITISAACNLTIKKTGLVSSRGKDPGADLVHLEAGGNVQVFGVVESTGPGHAVPNKPANYCSGPKRPGKPASSTACVEVWAGGNLVIDGGANNRGEINADTSQNGGHKIAWIDLFATGDITITGKGSGPYPVDAQPYAVHANQFTSNSTGGVITVKSKSGKVTLAGQAIQADGGLSASSFKPTLGGIGGIVTVKAAGDVDLGGASVRARGASSGGGLQAGGDIVVRSHNGHVVGEAPGEMSAAGGGGQGTPDPGIVNLMGCGTVPPAVSYAGTATPAAVTTGPRCGGAPWFEAYVVFPDSFCNAPPPPCEPANCPPPPCEGDECLPPAPATFCDKGSVQAVMNPSTGRFPGNKGPDMVVDLRTRSLQAALDSITDVNKDGYIIIGVVARDGGAPGGHGNQEVDVTRAYAAPFALIGCAVTLADPLLCDGHAPVHIHAGATSPELPVGSGVTLYFQEITTAGSQSAPGWLVEGDGRFLEAVGSQGNMQGIKVVGGQNTIHNGFANGNFIDGIAVQGNGNTIDGVEAVGNGGGDGFQVTGNKNTIINNTAGAESAGNGGNGISVNGKSNVTRGNGAFANGRDGINVSGGNAGKPNVVEANVAGGVPNRGNRGNGIVLGGTGPGVAGALDLLANTAASNALDGFKVTGTGHRLRNNSSGAASTNLACQYDVEPGNINATGNMSNGATVPGLKGSPFPAWCF